MEIKLYITSKYIDELKEENLNIKLTHNQIIDYNSLTSAIKENGHENYEHLEISPNSDKKFGRMISEKNLKIKLQSGKEMSVNEIYNHSQKIIKNNEKYLKFGDRMMKDKTFYDYLYMLALYTHKEYWSILENYKYFTNLYGKNEAMPAALFAGLLNSTDYLDIMQNSKEYEEYHNNIKINKFNIAYY